MEAGLGIVSSPGSFDLRLDGKTLVSHSSSRPFLRAGHGEALYEASHGSFRTQDRKRRIAAFHSFEIREASPSLVRIAFPGFGTLRLALQEGRLHLGFEDLEAGPEGKAWNRLVLALPAEPTERVYGCGEQFSYLDLRGHRVPIWVEEQGVGRSGPMKLAADLAMGAGGNRFTTYYPGALFFSSAGWSCLCRTRAWARFDFSRRREHRLEFREVPAEIVLDAAPTMCDLVGRMSALLGRQPLPPDWAFDGLILGAQGGTEAVLAKAKALKDAGAPVSAIWAQDWCGRRVTSFGSQLMWSWEPDEGLYPGLSSTMAKLGEEGMRFLGYINPFLAVDGKLYPEARDRGLCVKKPDGSDYLTVTTSFPAAMLDLTKPGTVEWIKGVIRDNMIGTGLSGWMADFGEYLPTDAVLASGESAELVHDEYPVLWAKANEEAVREAGATDEVLWFCRSGYIGALSTARHAASIWAGDQMVDWSRDDGMPSVIPAALSLGLCGAPFSHADSGGYTTVGWVRRSRELLLRWAELSAFTPVMRSHEGNRPASNAQAWDDAGTAAAVARMARIHAALAPYARSLAREYEADGLPLMRPLFLNYPDDPRCANLKDEYLYGADLLVVPVLRRGARRSRVYIPSGDWLGLWDGKPVLPGSHTVPAPIGRPPVFYRAGSPWAALFAGLARA